MWLCKHAAPRVCVVNFTQMMTVMIMVMMMAAAAAAVMISSARWLLGWFYSLFFDKSQGP